MPRINNKNVRDRRREGAETRQKQYDALSVQDKIARATERRGESRKELTRLRAGAID